MSHFSKIKIKITDREALIEELRALNVGQVVETGGICRGYQSQGTKVDILVRLSGSYDIGFVENDGGLECVADWYGIKIPQANSLEAFTSLLNQRYGVAVSKRELKAKGFSVTEEKLSNGTVRVVARRMA